MKQVKLMSSLILIIIIGVIVDCGGEEKEGPKQSYAVGGVFKEVWNGQIDNWRGVAVFGPMIPHVTINDDTIPWDFDLDYYYEATGTFWDSVPLTNGGKYDLKVDFLEYGVLEASATLPGVFSISPSGIYYLPVGSGFSASWTQADSANWYLVDFYIDYQYYYGGNYDWYWFDTSYITTTTSFLVSGSQLFPYQMDSITYSYGRFSVDAVNGPIPQPGSYGNITGDGYGFFLGAYFPEGTEIRIQGTLFKEEEHESRADAFFKSLKKFLPKE